MFYKALGFAVWRLAVAEFRRRYQRKAKVGAVLGLASLLAAAAYIATRPSE